MDPTRTEPVGSARDAGRRAAARTVAAVLLAATVGQLLLATLAPGLPQFTGKAFGARLLAYPLLMLAVPAVWSLALRLRGRGAPVPWDGCAVLMIPFLVDVTGNTLDLYDRVWWWDDANHAVNWLLLGLGVGLLLRPADVRPRWAVGALVAGIGALLAVGWELAEWATFIRHGTELDTAYADTLGDLALGTLGAVVAGALVANRMRA